MGIKPTDKHANEKRGHERHDYQEKVYFDFVYDFQTKVDFAPHDSSKLASSKKHTGFTRNISTQGVCFSSSVKLNEGVMLDMDVYIKNTSDPVKLQGEVRWSKLTLVDNLGNKHFDTGVHLNLVNGHPVKNSIHFDEDYKVYWSEVLESLIGQFRKSVKGRPVK